MRKLASKRITHQQFYVYVGIVRLIGHGYFFILTFSVVQGKARPLVDFWWYLKETFFPDGPFRVAVRERAAGLYVAAALLYFFRSWSGRQPTGWAPQVGHHRRYFFRFLEVWCPCTAPC